MTYTICSVDYTNLYTYTNFMKQVENLLHVQAKASSSDRRTVICQAGNVGNVGNVFSCARDGGSEAPSARNSMDRQEEIIVITTNYIMEVTYFSKKNLYKCNFPKCWAIGARTSLDTEEVEDFVRQAVLPLLRHSDKSKTSQSFRAV